jgi:mono/diheme cytochrome c family protein
MHMGTDRVATGLLAILAGVVMAEAAGAADAYNGGQIARRWCEPCHVVAGDQQGTTGEAPPFASIAGRPGFDSGRLTVFLLDPHPKMPNMSLTRIEAGDLAAYIASLGK